MEIDQVRTLFDYEPATGFLRWRVRRSRHAAGAVAGTMKIKHGKQWYVQVRFEGQWFAAHRLAFAWMTGRWPEHQIDHINLDRADNRWANLREATASQNSANRGAARTSKTGVKGVIVVERYGVKKYEARIRIDGKQKHLGRFDSAQEAHRAYILAAGERHQLFARG